MCDKMRYENKLKFPIPHKKEYKCPVVIWNKKGKGLFYDRNTKQDSISKKIEDIWHGVH